jgi:hypothetical protein
VCVSEGGLKAADDLEELVVDRRIILKWALKRDAGCELDSCD